MRVGVFSKEPEEIEQLLRKYGVTVSEHPDVIVCWGGDGTLLLAEHTYPGVPKLALGRSRTCKKCFYGSPEDAIAKLAANKTLPIAEQRKLRGMLNGTALPLALNDIVVRNKDQQHAIRFSVVADGKEIAGQIGDGVVIATPFGSTAYYQSVTRKTFSAGIGVAFNNTTEQREPLNATRVELRMERGDGLVTVDTLDERWTMRTGDVLTVELADETARIVAP